jgi:hypothetical protein
VIYITYREEKRLGTLKKGAEYSVETFVNAYITISFLVARQKTKI